MSFRLTIEYNQEKGLSEPSTNTITLEVSRLHRVSEISTKIFKDVQSDLRCTEDTYCLYWPLSKMWLTNNRPIGQILKGFMSANLQYRQKCRPFKIRFLDASSKRLIIDETLPVKEVVGAICKQLKISHSEELSLVVAVDYTFNKHHPAVNQEVSNQLSPAGAGSFHRDALHQSFDSRSSGSDIGVPSSPRMRRSQRPSSAGGRPGSGEKFDKSKKKGSLQNHSKRKQLSRKYQIRIDTPWLDPTKTLREQDVTSDDDLILMYRYYYYMNYLQRDAKEVQLLYKQSRAMFLAGEMTCGQDEVPRFTALLCQITKGNFISKEETQELLQKLKKLLAPPKYKSKSFVKEVVNYHQSLKGTSAQDAMCLFIKLWSTLNLFGTEFLSCINFDTKEKGLLGVSKEKIMFLHRNTKKKNQMWDKNALTSWEHDVTNEIVTLNFRDSPVDTIRVQLAEYSSVLVDCLKGHQVLSGSFSEAQLAQQEYQFDETTERLFSQWIGTTKPKTDHKRTSSLTSNDVYSTSGDIKQDEAATISTGEERDLRKSSWEGGSMPFGNLDQLMEERFSFLDFNEEEEVLTHLEQFLSPTQTSVRHQSISPSPSSAGRPSPLILHHQFQSSLSKAKHESSSSSCSSNEEDIQ